MGLLQVIAALHTTSGGGGGGGGTGGGGSIPPTTNGSYPDSNRIAFFPFSEGSGTSTSGGTSVTGTLHSVNFSGGEMAFDGVTGHYISVPGLCDTWPPVGSFTWEFTPNNISGSPRFFSKVIGSTTVQCYIQTSNGALFIHGCTLASMPGKTWVNGTKYRICVSWDAVQINIYINGVLYYNEWLAFNGSSVQVYQQLSGTPRPFIIGAYDQQDGTYPAPLNGLMDNFEIRTDVISAEKALADYNATAFTPVKYIDKLLPQAGTIILDGGVGLEYSALEPSLVKFGTSSNPYFLYYTSVLSSGTTSIHVATAPSANGPYTRQGLLFSDIVHTGAFVFGGFVYIVGGNKLYKSSDGLSFTAVGTYSISNGSFSEILGYGNFAPCIPMQLISGKYVMYVECNETADTWGIYRAESTSVEGAWTIVTKITSLKIGGTYGGPWLSYNGTNFRCVYHYCPVGFGSSAALPSWIAFATSPTGGNDWTIKEAPMLKIFADPYTGTNQNADPWPYEEGGNTWFVAELCNNPGGTQQSQIRLWTMTGLLT